MTEEQETDRTEPVIGCCPCIKRLMVVIMLGTLGLAGMILRIVLEDLQWNGVVEGRERFHKTDRNQITLFSDKFVITKNLGANYSSNEIMKAWKDLVRPHEVIKEGSFLLLGAFFSFVYGHFTGFCCCREKCFLNKGFRVFTYSLYAIGSVIFLAVEFGLYFVHAETRMNYKKVSDKLEAISSQNQYLLIGNTNHISAKTGELSSSKLQKICLMCYHNTYLTLMDMLDFQHVYPQNSPERRLIKIGIEYYHVDDLTDLGFCQRDIFYLFNILVSAIMVIICVLLPAIGFCQMNRRKPAKKVHPVMDDIVSESIVTFQTETEMSQSQ